VIGIAGNKCDLQILFGNFSVTLLPTCSLKYKEMILQIVDRDYILCYNYTIADKEIVPLSVVNTCNF
jgi:hypothetical protein